MNTCCPSDRMWNECDSTKYQLVWYQTTQHTATKHKHSTNYKQKHCKRDDKQLMWDLLQALNQKDEIHLIHHNITIDSVKLRAPELETGLYIKEGYIYNEQISISCCVPSKWWHLTHFVGVGRDSRIWLRSEESQETKLYLYANCGNK